MWSLSKMHQAGELVAAIAVVISLIFVGLQIRDNTIASEAATYQASVAYDIELLSNVAGNADLARIFYAYAWEPSDNLDGTELLQAQWHFTAYFDTWRISTFSTNPGCCLTRVGRAERR